MVLRLTEGLRKLGVNENDVVALVSKNRSELFVAALAAIFVGGTAAPIDPTMKVCKCLFKVLNNFYY